MLPRLCAAEARASMAEIRDHLRFVRPTGEAVRTYNVLQKTGISAGHFRGAAVDGAHRLDHVAGGHRGLSRVVHVVRRQAVGALHSFHLRELRWSGSWLIHLVMIFVVGFVNEIRSMITGKFRDRGAVMSKISRRKLIVGGVSAGGILLAGTASKYSNELYRVGEDLSRATHRLLLRNNPLAREFTTREISKNFPAIGTTMPESEIYQRLLHGRFAEWRLPVGGLVDKPMSFSLADLQSLPARTQITCSQLRAWLDGDRAVDRCAAQSLARLVKPQPSARWVAIYCADGWWDWLSLDHFEAMRSADDPGLWDEWRGSARRAWRSGPAASRAAALAGRA